MVIVVESGWMIVVTIVVTVLPISPFPPPSSLFSGLANKHVFLSHEDQYKENLQL